MVDYFQHLEVLEVKRKKRTEEKAKESRETKDKSYEYYPWTKLCEDVTKLIKSYVKVIVRHSLQQTSPLRASQPTLRNARTLTQNDISASAESSETDERD